jgi:NAD(P)H dehydrogenase (quinone)
VYYSAPGNAHGLARAVAEGAASVGVEVRLRHVAELNQELLISAKQYWGRHCSEIEHAPDGRLEDIEWADGIAFGTPTRFGNVSAQPKLFLTKAEARAEALELLPAA